MATKPEQKKSASRFFGYHIQNYSLNGHGGGSRNSQGQFQPYQRNNQPGPNNEGQKTYLNLNCVPTITHVISHHIEHKTSMLEKWLSSIKRNIVVPLHAGFRRELVTDNSRPLGLSDSSRLSTTPARSSNSDPNSIRIKVPIGSDQADHSRGTGS